MSRFLVLVASWVGVVSHAFAQIDEMISIEYGKTGAVVVFMSYDCPICKRYIPKLRSIYENYRNDEFEMYMVFPGLDSRSSVDSISNELGLNYTAILDSSMVWVTTFDARITPQVFLVNSRGRVVYDGPIDNYFYQPGKHRSIVSEDYLIDNMEALKSAKSNPLPFSSRKSIGCMIERAKE